MRFLFVAGFRFRGTPFVVAALMSTAAMFFIPSPAGNRHLASDRGPLSAGSGLPAAPDASATAAVTQSAAATPTPPPPAPAAAPAPPPLAVPAGGARTLRSGPVTLTVNGFWSWSLLDRRTGQLTGSANLAARSDTASMIKVWIAADFLRRTAERGTKPAADALRRLSVMIRDSDNTAASDYHRVNGGSASIARMVKTCGLTESRAVAAGSWSTTEVSARDGARLGLCIADGRAAGSQWTGWLLDEMRHVRGAGRFGIIAAFAPEAAAKIAIKNGWIDRRDGKWHIACLAVANEWTLTVLTSYPLRLGQGYGANICKQVAVQLAA
jgi:hypothetical protein